MVLVVSNQNYFGSGRIVCYWSPDWGDTWLSHPDSPIIAPHPYGESTPVPGIQRPPALVIDEAHGRCIWVLQSNFPSTVFPGGMLTFRFRHGMQRAAMRSSGTPRSCQAEYASAARWSAGAPSR